MDSSSSDDGPRDDRLGEDALAFQERFLWLWPLFGHDYLLRVDEPRECLLGRTVRPARRESGFSPTPSYVISDSASRTPAPSSPSTRGPSGRAKFLRVRPKTRRQVATVRGDDPELARHLRIEERELEAGGGNQGGQDREAMMQAQRFSFRIECGESRLSWWCGRP